jgi:YHS domain-containing protein
METNAGRLAERIDAEFDHSRESLRSLRQQHVTEQLARQERLVMFEKACGMMPSLWLPRLNVLKQRLGDRLKVPILLQAGRRQAEIAFSTSLARVKLSFKALTDAEVKTLVLEVGMEILPCLLPGLGSQRFEQPFSQVDAGATGEWIDSRIVDFARSYLTLYESDYCLSKHVVEDPVTHIRFPKFAAAAISEHEGKTLYFMALETREEFEKQMTKRLQDAGKA